MELPKEPIFSKVGKLWDLAEDRNPGDRVYPTGYCLFDKSLEGGFRPGELIIVTAESGEGKTTFCQYLTKLFSDKDWPSLWFSYEMNLWFIRKKFQKIGCDESLKVYAPVEDPLRHDVIWVSEMIREAIEDWNCQIIFIDNLHDLLPMETMDSSSVPLSIGLFVRKIKDIAKEKNVIIFLMVHTKKIYQTEKIDKYSMRDSGRITDIADHVILIERLKKEGGKLDGDSEWSNRAKISIAKNRQTGELRFITCEHRDGQFLEITNNYGEPPPY